MKLTKNFLPTCMVLTALMSLGGCAKLANLQELLALKAMSEEADQQDQIIDGHLAHFNQLKQDIEGDEFYLTQKSEIIEKYGEPIFCREKEYQGILAEECLYRYSTKDLNLDKVYFYFNLSGLLIGHSYISGNG